jgi:5-methylcytosine-specific restriction endonuclease McrA
VSEKSMNDELKRWIQESKKEVKALEENTDKVKKKPSGNCQICGEKTAKHVCIKCERFVCNSCYFNIIGICKKCVPPGISDKWDGSCPDWEKELGVDWID